MKIIVGDDTGLIKVVDPEKNSVVRMWGEQKLNKSITKMCWADPKSEDEIVVTHKDGTLSTYYANTGTLKYNFLNGTNKNMIGDMQQYKGLFSYIDNNDRRSIFTCTKAGNITIRSFNPHELQEYHDDDITDDNNNNSILANRNKYSIDISNFNVQAPVEVMKVFLPSGGSPEYAIGGKENNLKIYDVETQKIIYKPRNVGHNFLDMQMPIWITDLVYLDPFGQKLATCTGYHQIRLYDRRAFLNKPVMSKWTGEHPFKCMATTGVEHAVVVGDTIGTMFHFDFRQFGIIRKYRGIGGAVRAIQAHPLANYHQYKSNTCFIASCGADRYLRVYNMRTRARTHKLYLKQMLNCLLFTSEPLNANTGAVIEVEHSAKQKDDKEYDDMWEKLDQAIDENESEQKKAPKSAKPAQAQAAAAAAPTKKRKKDEDSDEDDDDEDNSDAEESDDYDDDGELSDELSDDSDDEPGLSSDDEDEDEPLPSKKKPQQQKAQLKKSSSAASKVSKASDNGKKNKQAPASKSKPATKSSASSTMKSANNNNNNNAKKKKEQQQPQQQPQQHKKARK